MSDFPCSLTTLDLTHALAPTLYLTKAKGASTSADLTRKRNIDQLAPTAEAPHGENQLDLQLSLPTSQSQGGIKRKTYKYSVDDLRVIRDEQYRFLHSLIDFFKEQKYPSDVTNATQRQNFKRRQSKFDFVYGVLYRKKGSTRLRILWEDEVEPSLREIHERGAHYPKDQGKFRQLVESVF
jgi:SMC interacting uncharacterized protein involved in chromosome segregation